MKKIFISIIAVIALASVAFAASLSDIDGHKNQKAIQYLADQGVIGGYEDGTFKPNKTVNRAELLKILIGGKGIQPKVEEYNKCFTDVIDQWFAPYVCYAKANDWVGGYSDGKFKPSQDVKKVEAIKMLVNSQEYEVPASVNEKLFDDTDSGAWYDPFLKVAKDKGLLEQSGGKYGVSDFMTRGEISENIYRAMTGYAKTMYKVVKVIDGDTIDVEIDGGTARVRLIGIDTPETQHPSKPLQCFGQEAADIVKEKLLNHYVTLEEDSTQDDKDKYDRLLRYVILEDGTNFAKWLISEGYGFEYTYNSAYKYQDDFKEAEKEASESKKGLWAENTCNGSIDGSTVDTTDDAAENPATYICTSNTYNCSDFKTHKDAQDAYDYCLAENGKDIHKLDSDNNGLACETLP